MALAAISPDEVGHFDEQNDPQRESFAIPRAIFFGILHVAAIAAIWQSNWAAVGICVLLHAVCGGLGICVGYHRLLTHRSFKTHRFVEYTLATLGSLSLQGGPIEWVALHRKHHQFSDKEGDPHSARIGFWWSHILWVLFIPSRKTWYKLTEKYTPDLLKSRYLRILERWNYLLLLPAAGLLYWMGGWPFVVWGIVIRLVLTYHHTWLVNSASHIWGYRNFEVPDLSTNNWFVAMFSYGEGWHNNHHAYPTSARHGMKRWELDPSYWAIALMKKLHLAWDLSLPVDPKQLDT